MLTPPPPYSRYFPSRFIEVPSDSEDEESLPTVQSKHLTTVTESTMTRTNNPCSTCSGVHHACPCAMHQASASNTRTSTGFTSMSSAGPLLLSSMPDLRPLLVEGKPGHRASAVWPTLAYTPGRNSPQVSAAVQASRSTTPASTRNLASAQVSTTHSRTSAVNSSPASLLRISNKEIDEIIADALDRYLSNQRPGMRATRVNVSGSYEDNSTIEFHDMGRPIAPWFAVICGRCPGIYHDLQEALHALEPSKLSQFEFCKCEADAAVLFLRALQSSRVGVIRNGKLYIVGPGMPLVDM